MSASWDAKRKAVTVTIDQKQTVDDEQPAYRFEVDLGFCGDVPSNLAANAGPGPLAGERQQYVVLCPLLSFGALLRRNPD